MYGIDCVRFLASFDRNVLKQCRQPLRWAVETSAPSNTTLGVSTTRANSIERSYSGTFVWHENQAAKHSETKFFPSVTDRMSQYFQKAKYNGPLGVGRMCGCDPKNVGGTSLAQRLDVEHALLQVLMNAIAPQFHRVLESRLLLLLSVCGRPGACSRRTRVIASVHENVQIFPSPLAGDIRIVRSRDEADRLRRAGI